MFVFGDVSETTSPSMREKYNELFQVCKYFLQVSCILKLETISQQLYE